MHAITRSCVLLWIHMLTFVRSEVKDCTLAEFTSSHRYDSNFDITSLKKKYAPGSQVRVSCNIGYTGFFKMSCTENSWIYQGAECQPRSCGHPGDAQFADFELEKGEDFVFGSQVVYTCHKGYQMVSRTNYRRCLAGGWDGVVPICEALQCPVIRVDEKVQVFGDLEEATYGNVIRFRCKSSTQILKGLTEIYCDENAEWSGEAPKCEEVTCAVPVIENGFVRGEILEYKEHELLHFACNPTYKRSDERDSKCTKIGATADWSPTPACEPIKCVLEKAVEGTTYEPAFRNLFSPGDTVTVTCKEKYKIFSSKEISVVSTCKDNGEWSIRPICEEVRCRREKHPSVSYWNFYWGQRKTLGDTVGYECIHGYKKTDGAARLTCTVAGWSPNPPCQEITCDRKVYSFADIIYNHKQKYRLNEQVYYECKDHYRSRFTLTCRDRGWDGQHNCEATTCDKKVFPFADITYNHKQKYRLNEQVSYVCKNHLQSRFTLTCTNGDWTGEHNCDATTCDKKVFPFADITDNLKQKYNLDEQVHYVCKDRLQSRFTLTCTNGKWTGEHNCDDTITCPEHQIIQNGYSLVLNGTLYYACNKDYKLSTKAWWGEAKCNNGQWSDIQRCIAKSSCGEVPHIPHMRNNRGNNQRQIPIDCEEGYHAKIPYLTCKGGKWDSNKIPIKNICEPVSTPCKAPPRVDNAIVKEEYQNEYFSGSTVTYQCRENYIMEPISSQSWITCTNGQWDEVDIKCTTHCPKPTFEDKMTITEEKEKYTHGDDITYECDTPGKNKVQRSATCVHGKWNKTVTCDVCSRLPDVPHGNISEDTKKDQYEEGHVIHFTCETGYISGPIIRYKCGSDGWIPIYKGSCKLKQCELPDDTPNGYYQIIHGDDFVFGATIKYFCNEGYQMASGEDTRTCNLDQWSNSVPVCDQITCKIDAMPPHLRVAGGASQPGTKTVNIGQTLSFSCDDGYERDGPEEIQCLETGEWNVPFPTCSALCTVRGVSSGNVRVRTYVDGQQLRKGEKLTFYCPLRGHSLQGKQEVECLGNGQWSGPFPTCGDYSGCEKPPSLQDGDIKSTTKRHYEHNERVEYMCQNYYIMEGGPYKTCNNGEWIGEIRCLNPCTVDEELMNAHNIEFGYKDEKKLYSPHGDHITFKCIRGTREDGRMEMRQQCIDGVMNLPTCH